MTPCVDPERGRRRRSAVPQRLPVGALEVERVDVLVLLRRVLGVLDRAVGPVAEPLGVLGDPRVVGRALERDVERQLDAALAAAAASVATSSSVPSSGWTAVWPPSAPPIAHGLPTSSGAGVVGVVAALAVRRADRVDRRQVERRRSPSRRRSRGARSRRASVPWPAGRRRVERGKSSYQAEKRARGRGRRRAASSRSYVVAPASVGVAAHELPRAGGRARRRSRARCVRAA